LVEQFVSVAPDDAEPLALLMQLRTVSEPPLAQRAYAVPVVFTYAPVSVTMWPLLLVAPRRHRSSWITTFDRRVGRRGAVALGREAVGRRTDDDARRSR
jgi:hypothetical protein